MSVESKIQCISKYVYNLPQKNNCYKKKMLKIYKQASQVTREIQKEKNIGKRY